MYSPTKQGSKWEKISKGIVALPSFPSSLKLALFWPLIDVNISDELPKFHKKACKAYRYVFSQERSASMLSRRPRKYRYAILFHTVPLQALVPECKTHKVTLISISLTLSQTPAYTSKPMIWGQCLFTFQHFRRYSLILPMDEEMARLS